MNNTIQFCSVCCHNHMEEVLFFPQLPLTGIYITGNDTYPKFDQGLVICNHCGHVQLKNMIDSEYLYKDTYSHRSGESPISRSGNDFFISYLKKIVKKEEMKSIFEIGCNDLYLLSQLEDFADELVGVDPIWDTNSQKGKITILGGFAEDIDFTATFQNKPNIIISSHTFEHIQDVHKVLQNVLENVNEDTRFLIEIPSLDSMLKLCRFDQVFHQHFNYFSLHSFFNFIQLHGCEYLEHTINYNYWGGTMLISFKKGGNLEKKNPFKKYTKEDILSQFNIFKSEIENVQKIVKNMDLDIYGFGAAQMLPILAYHFEDFSFVKAIIDDNQERCNKKLVGLNIPIVHSKDVQNTEDSIIMITALDSSKAILARLCNNFNPKYIIKPIQIF